MSLAKLTQIVFVIAVSGLLACSSKRPPQSQRAFQADASTTITSAPRICSGCFTWRQQAALLAPDAASSDMFGHSVGVSADLAVVDGRAHFDGANPYQGAVYTFKRSGAAWTADARPITAPGNRADGFGTALSLSENELLVGAPSQQVGPQPRRGAAYVYLRSHSEWLQDGAALSAADGEGASAAREAAGSASWENGDDFGCAVGLDRDTAFIGAQFHHVGANISQGAVYVFSRTGGRWVQQGPPLTAPDGSAGDHFGKSLALFGGLALVGAPRHPVDGKGEQGAVYAFVRSASSWDFRQRLTAADGDGGDQFGGVIGISGNLAIIGAHTHSVAQHYRQGAAYVFVLKRGSWEQAAVLSPVEGGADDRFGYSVSLASNVALVGSIPYKSGNRDDKGAVAVFGLSNGSWKEQGSLLSAPDGIPYDNFGSAIAAYGDTALIGADQISVHGLDKAGAAYVWTRQ